MMSEAAMELSNRVVSYLEWMSMLAFLSMRIVHKARYKAERGTVCLHRNLAKSAVCLSHEIV